MAASSPLFTASGSCGRAAVPLMGRAATPIVTCRARLACVAQCSVRPAVCSCQAGNAAGLCNVCKNKSPSRVVGGPRCVTHGIARRGVACGASSSSGGGDDWLENVGGGGEYDDFFQKASVEVFGSEIVVQEFNKLMQEFQQLSALSSKYTDFDLTGKSIYLENFEGCVGRMEAFIFRARMLDKPFVKDMLRQMDAQFLNAGLNFNAVLSSSKEQIMMCRKVLEEEERLSADSANWAGMRSELQNIWALNGAAAMPDIQAHMHKPEVVRAMTDPQMLVAIKEISENLGDAGVIAKWETHEVIGPLITIIKEHQVEQGLLRL